MDLSLLARVGRYGIDGELQEALFRRCRDGIDFYVGTHDGAGAVVASVQVRAVVVPADPFHIVVAVGESRIDAKKDGIGSLFDGLFERIGVAIHFYGVEETCRLNGTCCFV